MARVADEAVIARLTPEGEVECREDSVVPRQWKVWIDGGTANFAYV